MASSVLASLSPDELKILATEMFKPGILEMLARQTPYYHGRPFTEVGTYGRFPRNNERFTFKTRRTKREARSSDMATMVDDIEHANAAYKPPTIIYHVNVKFSTPEEIRTMRRQSWADPIIIIKDI